MDVKAFFRQKWPYIYFAILTVIVFADFIFSNKMLFGSDNIEAGLFFRGFYAEFFKTYHRVPLWNRFIFGGLPFVDAMHGDIFFPFTVIQFILPLYKSLGYKLLLTLPMAGSFTYLYLRKMKMTQWASVFGATTYMLSGFLVSLVYAGHDGRMYITSLFPLLLYTMEIAFQKGRLFWWWPFAVAFGIMVLANHPQFAYFGMWCVGAYFVMKVIFLYKDSKKLRIIFIPIIGFIAAMIIGLALGAVQIWPAQDYVRKYSPRSGEGRGYDYASSWSLHSEEVISQAVPGFAGVSNLQNHPALDMKNPYWGKNYFKINSEYAGMVALYLGLMGFFIRRDRYSYFFLGTAIFAILYGLGKAGLVFTVCYYIIPMVSKFRAPSTIMFLFCFAVAFLGARTVHFLQTEKKIPKADKIFRWSMIVSGVYVLMAVLIAASGESIMKIYTSIFYSNIETGQWNNLVESLTSIAVGFIIGAFLLAATVITFRAAIRRKMPFTAMALVLIALVLIDNWLIEDRKFVRTVDYRPYFVEPATASFLETQKEPFRTFAARGTLPNQNALAMFGLDQVAGYHGNQLRWYNDFLDNGLSNQISFGACLALANARYLIIPQKFDHPDFAEVASFPRGVTIYENKDALPRGRIVREWKSIADPDSMLKEVFSPDFDYSRKVIIDGNPSLIITQSDSASAAGDSVEFLECPPDQIKIRAVLGSPGLLSIQDNWYPYWRAYEGKTELKIFRADYTFMTVELPAGEHILEFRVENPNYIYARALSEFSWLVIIVGAIVIAIFRKMRRKKAESGSPA